MCLEQNTMAILCLNTKVMNVQSIIGMTMSINTRLANEGDKQTPCSSLCIIT